MLAQLRLAGPTTWGMKSFYYSEIACNVSIVKVFDYAAIRHEDGDERYPIDFIQNLREELMSRFAHHG